MLLGPKVVVATIILDINIIYCSKLDFPKDRIGDDGYVYNYRLTIFYV